MTKTLYLTNILEFSNIRVTCKECGLPQIATEKYLPPRPEQCPQCRTTIDSHSIVLIEELRKLISTVQALEEKKLLRVTIEFESKG